MGMWEIGNKSAVSVKRSDWWWCFERMRVTTATRAPPSPPHPARYINSHHACKWSWAVAYSQGVKIFFLSSSHSGEERATVSQSDCQNRSENWTDDLLALVEVTAVLAPVEAFQFWTHWRPEENVLLGKKNLPCSPSEESGLTALKGRCVEIKQVSRL